MKVLMIENEKSVAEKIETLLNTMDDSIRVIAVMENIYEAARWVQLNQVPDIILANKVMLPEPGWNRKENTKAYVTFSTPSGEFYFHAFRYKTIKDMIQHHSFFTKDMPPGGNYTGTAKPLPPLLYKERFLVKQGQKLLSVSEDQIAYFFSQGRFIFFKTTDNQKFLTEYRIEQLENILKPARFFRINRSYIVSFSSVKEIHSYFGNRLKLYLSPPCMEDVIVSRKRVSDFKNWLGK